MNQAEIIIKTLGEFIVMIITGAFLGFVFDIFRSMRRAVKQNKVKVNNGSVLVQDIIFLLVTFVVLVLVIYGINGGILRAYIFIGCCAGFITYFMIASPVFGRLCFGVFYIIVKSIVITFKLIRKLLCSVIKIFAKKHKK